jgi:ketose-bisphosphate aldolase
MLVSLQEILAIAEKGGFAVPAMNVYNMETVMGVIKAAEEAKAPVIMQFYSRLATTGFADYLAPIVLKAAEMASVPVCMHLDHGAGYAPAAIALKNGASGIMVDFSALPFDENVEKTARAVEILSAMNIGVEGELGHIGSVNDDAMDEFTDPAEAAEFVKQTGVCCLAVLIGNAHGHYKKTPCLDIERVKAIREATGGIPLVLHGGSGIPDDQVKAAIAAGIRKMNIGTDVCCAFADGTLESLNDPKRSLAIDLFMKKPIESVKALALDKIRLVGAEGKAK